MTKYILKLTSKNILVKELRFSSCEDRWEGTKRAKLKGSEEIVYFSIEDAFNTLEEAIAEGEIRVQARVDRARKALESAQALVGKAPRVRKWPGDLK